MYDLDLKTFKGSQCNSVCIKKTKFILAVYWKAASWAFPGQNCHFLYSSYVKNSKSYCVEICPQIAQIQSNFDKCLMKLNNLYAAFLVRISNIKWTCRWNKYFRDKYHFQHTNPNKNITDLAWKIKSLLQIYDMFFLIRNWLSCFL